MSGRPSTALQVVLAIVEPEASVRAGALGLIVAIRRNRSKSQRELMAEAV